MKGPAPIKAVIKTMKILECLSYERSLGITELTGHVSAHLESIPMDKSTVYRFLVSLMDLGFVYQDPQTEKYGLTLKLFEIGMSVLERLELWREAEPIVKEIARVTGETVHLATLDEDNLVYLGKFESMRTLRVSMMSRVGRSAPAYCTGVGKILLAYLPRERLDYILQKEKPVQYTDKTLVRRADLDRELSSIVSPRPEPGVFRSYSPRNSRSKTFSNSSSGTVSPVLASRIRKCRSRLSIEISMLPPKWVCLMALERTLVSARSSRARSPRKRSASILELKLICFLAICREKRSWSGIHNAI